MALFINIFLVGIGLSMDAFAVSVCKGLSGARIKRSHIFITALSFGLFQSFMPLLGWLLGESVQWLIEPVDHWIAFILLAAIGSKMIWDAFHEDGDGECAPEEDGRKFWIELFMLSVATSIDAFVVGISFAMAQIPIVEAMIVIGLTTFVLSLIGFLFGRRFGSRFERPATIAGGVILILLGIKVLLEHLGFLA